MKYRRGFIYLLFIVMFLYFLVPVHAENITLQPGSEGNDTYIRQDLAGSNFGTATELNFGLTGSGDRMRVLFQFNLSFIPSGSTITYAEFRAFVNFSQQATTWQVNLSRITQDWAEAEATWNNRFSSTTWTTSGASFSATPENYTNISNSLGWYNWSIRNLVQSWVNGTYTNYGFIIIGQEETANDFKKLFASDVGDSTVRPMLIINWTANANPTISAIADSSNATNPTSVGLNVTFNVTWNDIDSSQASIWLCNSTNVLSNFTGGCADRTFCSTGNATTNPAICQYTTQNSDSSLLLYYVLVCDNEGNCSSISSANNFSVNHLPNATVVSPNGGERVNQSQGNFSIKFNVSDSDNNTLKASIYYSSTQGAKTNIIASDINLSTYCTDSDSSTATANNCTYGWNSSGIFGAFYLDILVNDTINTSIDSSDNTFNVTSLIDNIPPNVTNQSISGNLTSGEIAVIRANVTEDNVNSVWFEAIDPNSIKANYTMQLQSGSALNGIYNGTFEVGITGTWNYQVFGNDSLNNIGNGSLLSFNVSKPNATPQNELYQPSALTNELISIRAELNATNIVRNVSAYLNDSNYFIFLSGYPKNQTLGDINASNVSSALWLLMSPKAVGTYNLTIIWTDKYSNSWNSSQINISVVSSTGNPITVSADAGGAYFQGNNLLIRARLENQNGNGITGATVTTTIYYPNGTLWLNAYSMTEEVNGSYNFTNNLTGAPRGVYNVKVKGTSGSSSSTAQTSFSVLEKTTANITLVKINSYPEVVSASQYLADILVKDQNGNYVNASTVRILVFDSLGNLVAGPVDFTSQTSTGRYRYNYTTPSTPQGLWETTVNVTRDGIDYFDRQYWKLVGGPFDVRDIVVSDSVVPNLVISVMTENTGSVVQDLTLTWNLSRTDIDSQLDSGADTFAVSGSSTKTWTIYPTTSFEGNAKIAFVGRWSSTEKAAAFKLFTTTSSSGGTSGGGGSSGGGSGGGAVGAYGGIAKQVELPKGLEGSKLEFIEPKKIINATATIGQIVTVIIKNTGNTTLHNIILSMEGLPSGWYKVEPPVVAELKPNEVEAYYININVQTTDVKELRFSYVATSNEATAKEEAILIIETKIDKSAINKLKKNYEEQLGELQKKIDNLKYTVDKSSELKLDFSEISILIKLADEKIRDAKNQVKSEKFGTINEDIEKAKSYVSEAESKLRALGVTLIEKPPSIVIRYWIWIVTWIFLALLISGIYILYKRMSLIQIFTPRKKEEEIIERVLAKDKLYSQEPKERLEKLSEEDKFHIRIKKLQEKLSGEAEDTDVVKGYRRIHDHKLIFVTLIFAVLLSAIYFNDSNNKLGITGYAVLPLTEQYWAGDMIKNHGEVVIDNNFVYSKDKLSQGTLEFRARVSDDVSKYGSWLLGGFAGDRELNSNEKAVFYVDSDIMKAFVSDGNKIYWCSPITNYDWKQFHKFKITISDKTEFYVDNARVCAIDNIPNKELPVAFNENSVKEGESLILENVEINV